MKARKTFALLLLPPILFVFAAESPRFENPRPAANGAGVIVEVNGNAAQRYRWQSTTNFNQWTDGDVVQGSADRFELTLPFAPERIRFFRLRQEVSGPDTAAPNWPANARLRGMTRDFRSAELRWDGAADNVAVAGYRIWMDTNQIAVLPSGARAHTVSNLNPGSSYFFRIEAVDAAGNVSEDVAQMAAIVPMANSSPVALTDYGVTAAGVSYSFNPLANDLDENGDPLRIESITQPRHGTVSRNGDQLTYTPNPGFSGRDEFAYVVSDGRGLAAAKKKPLAFEASTNATRVGIVVAALTAWVIDGEPASTNEFPTLSAAIEWLNATLLTNQAGRIKIKRRGAIPVSILELTRHIHIESDDGVTPVTLSGGNVQVSAPSSVGMSKVNFACDSLVITASGAIDIVGTRFEGPTIINAGFTPSPVPARAGSIIGRNPAPPAESVRVQDSEHPEGLTVNGKVGCSGSGNGDLTLERTRGSTLEVNATYDCNAEFRAAYTEAGQNRYQLKFNANSHGEMRGVNSANLFTGNLEFDGQNEFRSQNSFAGQLDYRLGGIGEGKFWVGGNNANNATFNLRSRLLDFNGKGNVYGGASFVADGDAGFTASIRGTEEGSQVRLASNFLSGENGRGFFEFQETDFLRRFDATLGAEFRLRFGVLEFRDRLSVTARGGRSQRDLQLDRVDVRNTLEVLALNQSLLTVDVAGGVAGGVGVFSRDLTTVNLRSDGLILRKTAAAVENAIDYVTRPFLGGSTRASSGPVARDTATVSIRNTRLEGNFPFSLANPPTIHVSGATGPVEIGNNILDQSGWISVTECEGGPVRIFGNQIRGRGISIDGDLEGEGLTGKRTGLYEVSNNTIITPAVSILPIPIPLPFPIPTGTGIPALSVQDIAQITVASNRIESGGYLDRGVTITSSRATLANNAIEMTNLFQFFGSALEVLAGPGGPAVVTGQSNTFRGTVTLGPGGHGQFTGDRITGNGLMLSNAIAYFDRITIVSNQFLVQGSSLRIAGSRLSDTLLPLVNESYLELQNSELANCAVSLGVECVASISGNRFNTCSLTDSVPSGGIVQDPIKSNSGLSFEDLSSEADWDGNDCVDYPLDCNQKDDVGVCFCEGFTPPRPRTMPPLPAI